MNYIAPFVRITVRLPSYRCPPPRRLPARGVVRGRHAEDDRLLPVAQRAGFRAAQGRELLQPVHRRRVDSVVAERRGHRARGPVRLSRRAQRRLKKGGRRSPSPSRRPGARDPPRSPVRSPGAGRRSERRFDTLGSQCVPSNFAASPLDAHERRDFDRLANFAHEAGERRARRSGRAHGAALPRRIAPPSRVRARRTVPSCTGTRR